MSVLTNEMSASAHASARGWMPPPSWPGRSTGASALARSAAWWRAPPSTSPATTSVRCCCPMSPAATSNRRFLRAFGRVRAPRQRRTSAADHAGRHRGGPLQPRLPVATPGGARRHLRRPDVHRVGGSRGQRGVPGDPRAAAHGRRWRPRGRQLLLPRSPRVHRRRGDAHGDVRQPGRAHHGGGVAPRARPHRERATARQGRRAGGGPPRRAARETVHRGCCACC